MKQVLGGKLYEKLRLHDTCGVNNLHGIPGVMAGLLSVFVTLLASEATWGVEMYKVIFKVYFNRFGNKTQVFPRVAPEEGSFSLDKIQEIDSHISAGEGRSIGTQALMQLLGITKLNGVQFFIGICISCHQVWPSPWSPLLFWDL